VKVSYQRHLLQLGLADRLLGELLARLRRLGLFRDALVVVVADHGIGFRVGVERRTVTPGNVEDLAPVPLLVKLPGQRRGRIVDAHVETIDVLPTILDVAQVRTTREMDGRSLLRPIASQAERVRIFHRIGTTLNTIGGEYSFDPTELARRRQAAVRRKLALFGSGSDLGRLYGIGPHPELIGHATADLLRVDGAAAASFHQAEELRHVDPTSGFVPGEITGEIPGGRTGGGRPIALALDGTIVAVGRTFSLAGSTVENFELIVPEAAFRRGAMEARVFEIVLRRDGLALRPL
jgi:arylsulfatase A-like enzyme